MFFKFFSDLLLTPIVAGHAGIFPIRARFTQGGRLVLDQSLLYQTVSRLLKGVQRDILDTAFEKATLLFTVFRKLGLLLEKS